MWYNYSFEFFTWGSVQIFPRLWDPFPPLSLLSEAQRLLLPLSALARILSRAPTDLPVAAVPTLLGTLPQSSSLASLLPASADKASPLAFRSLACRKKKGERENQRMERGEQGMEGSFWASGLDRPKAGGSPICPFRMPAGIFPLLPFWQHNRAVGGEGASKGLSWHPWQLARPFSQRTGTSWPCGGCPGTRGRLARCFFSLRLLRASHPSLDLWTPRTRPGCVFKTWASFMAPTSPFLSPGSGPELARTPSAS